MGNNYFRKPTPDEIAESSNEINKLKFGDGFTSKKRKQPLLTGIKTDSPIILHAHHKYYIYGVVPWDYPLDAMESLCHTCHSNIHGREIIPVYADRTLSKKEILTPCTRCNGTGFLKQFLHVENGICFRCLGTKFEETISQNSDS